MLIYKIWRFMSPNEGGGGNGENQGNPDINNQGDNNSADDSTGNNDMQSEDSQSASLQNRIELLEQRNRELERELIEVNKQILVVPDDAPKVKEVKTVDELYKEVVRSGRTKY